MGLPTSRNLTQLRKRTKKYTLLFYKTRFSVLTILSYFMRFIIVMRWPVKKTTLIPIKCKGNLIKSLEASQPASQRKVLSIADLADLILTILLHLTQNTLYSNSTKANHLSQNMRIIKIFSTITKASFHLSLINREDCLPMHLISKDMDRAHL